MTQGVLEKENIPTFEDDMGQYLREIRQYPILTPEQERKLAADCARGDADAIRIMVNSNLRLVVSVAREYAGRGVPLLDLIQEGSIGLLAAAKKFDPSFDCRFSTYATKWIRQGVNRCVLNHAGLIRVPLHTRERMQKLLRAKAELYRDTGVEPDIAELAACVDMSPQKAQELLSLLPQVCSLDAPAGADDHDALQMLLEDDRATQPHAELVRREMKELLNRLMEELTPKQQQVLRLRYGMDDGICLSFEKIGAALNVSKERARQIEHQAMDKLQKLGAAQGLEDYLNV